jgi:hypothetical protein
VALAAAVPGTGALVVGAVVIEAVGAPVVGAPVVGAVVIEAAVIEAAVVGAPVVGAVGAGADAVPVVVEDPHAASTAIPQEASTAATIVALTALTDPPTPEGEVSARAAPRPGARSGHAAHSSIDPITGPPGRATAKGPLQVIETTRVAKVREANQAGHSRQRSAARSRIMSLMGATRHRVQLGASYDPNGTQ